jgi:23S rRNA (guanosine2251-2'-O)-methyltransferase
MRHHGKGSLHRRAHDDARSRQGKAPGKQPYARAQQPDEEVLRIWGTHAVEAALANPNRIVHRLHLTENAENRLAAGLSARRPEIARASPRDLDRLVGPDSVHQGAIADVEPLPETDLDAVVQTAVSGGGAIVVLDQVTDPHNVGAILRSAAVFGAAGLVMTRRHSPPLSGALAKTASGALEAVPVTLVPNLARALAELGEAGVTRIGLDGEGEHLIAEDSFTPPTALVLGAEGKGLRRLTRELCDRLCRIGSAGALASLNVSNAAAVALYAASLKR